MLLLPTPKRFAITLFDSIAKCFFLHADNDVVEFVNTLKSISSVTYKEQIKCWIVDIDPRYAYDENTARQTYAWIVEQIEMEFGDTKIPPKAQPE